MGRERNLLRPSSDPALAGLGSAKAAPALLSSTHGSCFPCGNEVEFPWNEVCSHKSCGAAGSSCGQVTAACRAQVCVPTWEGGGFFSKSVCFQWQEWHRAELSASTRENALGLPERSHWWNSKTRTCLKCVASVGRGCWDRQRWKGCSAEICWAYRCRIIDSFICETLVLMWSEYWAAGCGHRVSVYPLHRCRISPGAGPGSRGHQRVSSASAANRRLAAPWQMRLSGFSPKSAGFCRFLHVMFFKMHRICILGAVDGEILLIRGCGLAT